MDVPQTSSNTMKKRRSVSALPFLPQDILVLILVKLPAKSLARFKCVSKFFCCLVADLLFVDLHRKWSLTLLSRASILVSFKRRTLHAGNYRAYYTINLSEENQGKLRANRVGYLVGDERFRKGRLGSLDGVICMSRHNGNVSICNVSTRQRISPPRTHPDSQTCCALLGFDSASRRYKVLKSAQFFDQHMPSDTAEYKHWVFTVGVDESWREITCFPRSFYPIPGFNPFYSSTSVHIDGVIYSYNSMIKDKTLEIAAFDIGSEDFSMIPLPDEFSGTFYFSSQFLTSNALVEVDGRLGMVLVGETDRLSYVDVWTWEKSAGRWEKFTIPIPIEGARVIRDAWFLRITMNHAGEILFLCATIEYASLLVCNLKTQVWRKFEIVGLEAPFAYSWKVVIYDIVDNVFSLDKI